MTFEDYLISKKIDGKAFQAAEPELYKTWNSEFVQMHPNSFTAQKLYLINPLRLKYTLKNSVKEKSETGISNLSQGMSSTEIVSNETETKLTPKPPRPVFKPKPKIN